MGRDIFFPELQRLFRLCVRQPVPLLFQGLLESMEPFHEIQGVPVERQFRINPLFPEDTDEIKEQCACLLFFLRHTVRFQTGRKGDTIPLISCLLSGIQEILQSAGTNFLLNYTR